MNIQCISYNTEERKTIRARGTITSFSWEVVGKFLFLGWWATCVSCLATPLAEKFTPETEEKVKQLRKGPFHGKYFERMEHAYQMLVQAQTFVDLIKLYDPKNQDRLRITYPSFTPRDAPHGGPDLGFGLHVVKRLVLPLEKGRSKIIDVNEHWPQDGTSGGLFLPDEIRMKTLVFEGERYVRGSEELYVFDSLRLGWGPSRELGLHRQTRYIDDPASGKSRKKIMHVPVSAPSSCSGCHAAGNRFAERFAAENEKINPEAIVQDRYFSRPLETTEGFQGFLKDLRQRGRSQESIDAARHELLNPVHTMQVPGLLEILRKTSRDFSWLGEDQVVEPLELSQRQRQGVYRCSHELCLDSLETTVSGKYLWWEPEVVIAAP